MKFRCKNLLVTGGAGFIGSNFIEYLLEKYDDIIIFNLDFLTYAGNLINTENFKHNKRYKFIHGNISDEELLDKIFKDHKIDGVINFAAESHVDNSIKNPEIFIETNLIGVYKLLHTCYKNWMVSNFKYKSNFTHSRFHQISTDEVYGSIKKGSSNESDKYYPNSPYSSSKASADLIVRSFNKTFGLNTTISICSNNFGPNQHDEKLIPKVIKSILNDEPIPVYGDGKNIRDWIYVLDHCKAIDEIYSVAKSGMVYNVGANNELSNIDIIDMVHKTINKYLDKSINLNFIEDRHGHDFRYSLDTRKISKEIGWKASENFQITMENYIISKINK
ncbi:MAG: dTDP-glucose 4,6-dehydratase [Flavobacteriaceae bacterium]|nr:dTDP-glucose 4,6-dehydratase [Flavobacteriaceae bacterium]|tara:strand:+ start:6526 stop:7524 length:999 start_codon:yes stop_codon:yes gene_type:complete